ncbi:DUF4230 domain-containing protein [Winogradskyella litorisediminis]|uniref:DUF4230 domain-containing protein n=1 Tax=Winogradskyella litorisediminis TaxID=1156618 RepID=A0ABW3N7X1_9FLAO
MRKFLFGIFFTILIVLIYKQCTSSSTLTINNSSALIQEQLKNVSKLVVSEGQFSEVFNYKNSKAIFGELITAEKKALVVVNAKATISYDLQQLKYELDEKNKILKIVSIPDYEISLNPDLQYYDVQADFLNQFEAEDYNNIKKTINDDLIKKIKTSSLVSNAQNRLISEVSKFYILTNSLGWKLIYNNQEIKADNDFERLLL